MKTSSLKTLARYTDHEDILGVPSKHSAGIALKDSREA